MKPQFKQIVTVLISAFLLSCSTDDSVPTPISTAPPVVTPPVVTPPVTNPTTPVTPVTGAIKYLALGDSYTIGQSVCETCRFPEQLKSGLMTVFPQSTFSVNVIATTGWTTTNLISAINTQNPASDNDLVTLLIGVNNQYQHKDFSVYEKEFPILLSKAIQLAKGDKKNVIVLSIPDYAYTPYAKNMDDMSRAKISSEINQYNSFAENQCMQNQVTFISITDITRQGLTNPNLVANDGLHPSQTAYKMFVDRMLPQVKMALQD